MGTGRLCCLGCISCPAGRRSVAGSRPLCVCCCLQCRGVLTAVPGSHACCHSTMHITHSFAAVPLTPLLRPKGDSQGRQDQPQLTSGDYGGCPLKNLRNSRQASAFCRSTTCLPSYMPGLPAWLLYICLRSCLATSIRLMNRQLMLLAVPFSMASDGLVSWPLDTEPA